MARAIDSEVAFRFLTEQIVKETGAFSKGVNKGLNIARSAIRNPDAIPTLTPPNEPLTLDELREMDGQPIYVTTKNYGDGWCILNWHGVNKSYTYFSRAGTSEGMTATPISAKTYGDLWLAYRRPPEGGIAR
ncbi:MAG TPA: hypothetical protein IAB55_06555 [Candidatus Merdivicinus faecavium]|nr:hypothetical protein [Candidatus Merdivicinus faecavium]